jgi:hypothetical protein
MDILKQAAQAALDAYDQHDPLGVVMADLRAALAQLEQEPVRKPLTVDQISEIDCYDHLKFARRIEKAHGIE